ncbi:hypothetical protein PHPALM_30829 [Phytophthora palmivora]|uniref:Uncharacterized protein n=1 Tax=Phytophthora palmivora TaxID=4796 RepID=A0A2P4X449_9STRA|nr:hypothetical protein PHPALM_30829 [Phytophthora palmivora]
MTEACPAISPDTAYDHGAAGASTIAPSGSGAPHADPATTEGAYPPLDSRYATADRVHAVEREFAQHRDFRDWVAVQLSHFADDLEQAEHHVDKVADQASYGVERLGNQQADCKVALERSNAELRDLVARLQGPIDLLVRLQRSGAQQQPLAFLSVLAVPR